MKWQNTGEREGESKTVSVHCSVIGLEDSAQNTRPQPHKTLFEQIKKTVSEYMPSDYT